MPTAGVTTNQLTDAFPWDPPPLTMVTIADETSITTTREEDAEKANTPAALWLGHIGMVSGLPRPGTPRSVRQWKISTLAQMHIK